MGQWTEPPGSEGGASPPGVPPAPPPGWQEPPGQSQWEPPYPIYQPADPTYLAPGPGEVPGPNGPATASLVCGIIALISGIIPLLFFIAVPVGLAAIITGLVGIRRAKYVHSGGGKAGTGLFTGVLGILAVVAWAVFLFTNEGVRAFIEQLQGIAETSENAWSTLAAGDCLLDFAEFERLETVEPVPCEQPHAYEVFASLEHPSPAEEYSGLDATMSDGLRLCEGTAFADYVGRDYMESRYFSDVIAPDAVSWRLGERRIICLLYDPDNLAITGSARGSGQ